MNLWNIKNLPIPPINTYKAENTNIDIKHLAKVFREGKQCLDKDHYMSAEYKIMSIIAYRTKQKFRSSKDFKAFDKMYKALRNYFRLDISVDLKLFIHLIPARYTEETYLPNKSILDYILVRLQGMVKLLERVVETSKITAYLFERRLHTGHFWKIAFIIFSLVSRIYILAKHRVKFICEFYNKIVPFSRQLRNSGRNWLPENYILPTDLQKWMNVNWLDIDDEIQIIETPEFPNIVQFFDLVDDDDVEFCDEYIMINDDDAELADEFKKLDNIKESIQKMRGFDMDEDIGEVIEVDDSLFIENTSVQTEAKTQEQEDDFEDSIELYDSLHELHENSFMQTTSKNDLNEIIILDNSLSKSNESCSDINDIIELDDSSLIVVENDVDKPNNSEVINILDNTLSELKETDCVVSSSPFSKEIQSDISSVNLSNDVITLLDTPIINKRNNEYGKSLKKKKNLKKDYKTILKKSSQSHSLGNETVTLPIPSIISTKNKKKKIIKNRNMKRNLITVSQKLLHNKSVSLGNEAVIPKLSAKGKRNKEKKTAIKNEIVENDNKSISGKSSLLQTDFDRIDNNAVTPKSSRSSKNENSLNMSRWKNDRVNISKKSPSSPTKFVSVRNETVKLSKSSALTKRSNEKEKRHKKESLKNSRTTVSEKSPLKTGFANKPVPKSSAVHKRRLRKEKVLKKVRLKNNQLTIGENPLLLQTGSLNKESVKLSLTSKNNIKKKQSPKMKSKRNLLPENSKTNWSKSGDSKEETIINISDSPSVHENENNNTIKTKKFKTKKERNAIENLSLTNEGSINKSKLSNTPVVDLCDKIEKNKRKQKADNSKVLSNVHTENVGNTSKRRKLEDVESPSCKEAKNIQSSIIIEESPEIRISSRKNKFARNGQFDVSTISPQIKIKEEPILIKDEVERSILKIKEEPILIKDEVERSILKIKKEPILINDEVESSVLISDVTSYKKRPKKKKKWLRDLESIIQQTNDPKYISNKTHANNSEINQLSHKKSKIRKFRYFLKTKTLRD